LREYIVKGFLLDDERLKNPDQPFDYFDELMRRIQDIRTSERRFYQKITDIYATSIDYDPTQEVSLLFFKTVQNKVHWAITGQTAAEIVHGRVDAAKPNLGLTNWRGAVIRQQDVSIAKNYLSEPELETLNSPLSLKSGPAPSAPSTLARTTHSDAGSGLTYTLSSTGKRHNSRCRHHKTGTQCGPNQGVACKT
jgi:hypothetical protein